MKQFPEKPLKKESGNYISARESYNISKENKRITNAIEEREIGKMCRNQNI
jgi:hypothetical protein